MPYEIVRRFEREVAEYAGAKYGVMVNSCTNALFLCCKYLYIEEVTIPKYTYPGVACSIINAGGKVKFTNKKWKGIYKLHPYDIYDSALRFRKNMYIQGSFYCISFHYKKPLPISHGGMILTDDENAYYWFKRKSFDGRTEGVPLKDDELTLGYHMNVTPEQAARGMMFFSLYKNKVIPDMDVKAQGYPDLSKVEEFK